MNERISAGCKYLHGAVAKGPVYCHNNRAGTSTKFAIIMATYQQQCLPCSVLTAQMQVLDLPAE